MGAATTDVHGAWTVPTLARSAGVPTSALVEVADPGRLLLTVVAPGYVTRLLVGPKGTRFTQFLPTEVAVASADRREAELAILDIAVDAVDSGWWEVAADSTSLVMQHLDSPNQPLNPTLSLLRAYALFRTGRAVEIGPLLERFVADHGWALHDLVMLQGMAGSNPPQLTVPVAPLYPLLTAGWALLPPEVPTWQAQARQALWPAPWATVDGAPDRVIEIVERGEA